MGGTVSGINLKSTQKMLCEGIPHVQRTMVTEGETDGRTRCGSCPYEVIITDIKANQKSPT